MIDKRQIQKCMTSLEDVRGLYSAMEQTTSDSGQVQEFKKMVTDIERHYHYLNSVLDTFLHS